MTDDPITKFAKNVLALRYGEDTWEAQRRFFIGSYVVFVIIGLSIPDNVISTHPGARFFSDVMASIVPQIDRITALGLSPEANRLNYSILWAISPLYFYLSFKWATQHIDNGFYRDKVLTSGKLLFLLVVSIWLCAFSMFLWVGESVSGHEPIVIGMFRNQIARALWAPIMVFAFVGISTSMICVTKGIFQGRIPVSW